MDILKKSFFFTPSLTSLLFKFWYLHKVPSFVIILPITDSVHKSACKIFHSEFLSKSKSFYIFSSFFDDYPDGCYLPAAAAKFDICSLEEEEEAEKEQNKVISPSYFYNSNTKKDNIVRLRTLIAWQLGQTWTFDIYWYLFHIIISHDLYFLDVLLKERSQRFFLNIPKLYVKFRLPMYRGGEGEGSPQV